MAEGHSQSKPQNGGLLGCWSKDSLGNTPLHLAAVKGHVATIKSLLNLGCGIEDRNDKGLTPLIMAAYSGQEEAVRCLVDEGADISAVSEDGSTVWHAAASSGAVSIIQYLSHVTKRACNDVNSKAFNERLLEEAANRHGKPISVDGMDKNKPGFINSDDGVDKMQIEHNSADDLGKNMSKRPEDNSEKKQLEHHKISSNGMHRNRSGFKNSDGSAKEVQTEQDNICSDGMVKNKSGFNSSDDSGNKMQVQQNMISSSGPRKEFSWENVYRLWDHNMSSDSEDDSIGDSSIDDLLLQNCNLTSVSYLTEAQASADIAEREKLLHFLENSFPYCVEVNKSEGYTGILQTAAVCGSFKIIDLLIKRKVNLNYVGKLGIRPIHSSAVAGKLDVFELLLKAGVDYNATDNFGRNALHFAALWKSYSIVKKLLTLGLSPNLKDKLGNTPLHLAAVRKNNLKVTQMLIENGAQFLVRNNIGETPFNIANDRGWKEMAELLSPVKWC